jgi:hypothetical protein
MQKNDLRVFPRPNGTWAMRRDGASRALSTHETKRAALQAARLRASRDGVDLTIENRRGWVTDPCGHLLDELARRQPTDDFVSRQRTSRGGYLPA